LTRKGIDLAPVLVDMVLWATAYEETDAPAETVRAMRADRTAFIAAIEKQWKAETRAPKGRH
jgi:hypothetical protein